MKRGGSKKYRFICQVVYFLILVMASQPEWTDDGTCNIRWATTDNGVRVFHCQDTNVSRHCYSLETRSLEFLLFLFIHFSSFVHPTMRVSDIAILRTRLRVELCKCGNEVPDTRHDRFCSNHCSNQAYEDSRPPRVECGAQGCYSLIDKNEDHLGRYCSHACAASSNFGRFRRY